MHCSKLTLTQVILFIGISVQFCLAWQVLKAQTIIPPDPCPNRVTVATTPCPLPAGTTLHADCSMSDCDGKYLSWSAEYKNTDTKEDKNSETWTTSTSYDPPTSGYTCATYVMCDKGHDTEECTPRNMTRTTSGGKLYTQRGC
jgi:hypothetical protein